MTDEPKGIVRIAVLLTVGLAPALAVLLITPGRGIAIAAAGSAAMAIGFVIWTQRLVADDSGLRLRDTALQNEVSALEEKLRTQTRELKDVRACDDVTGVLNRATFLRRVEEAVTRDGRIGKPLAFLLADVEGFRAMNTERGRLGGDAILRRVAAALQSATRGTDVVGRLGGDEFGVILGECEDPRPAVNRLFLALQSANAVEGAVPVHVAVGAVTIENPAQGVDVAELFRLAEGALASVRGHGGSLCARRTLRADASSRATA